METLKRDLVITAFYQNIDELTKILLEENQIEEHCHSEALDWLLGASKAEKLRLLEKMNFDISVLKD